MRSHVKIADLIDASPIRPLQVGLFALCLLSLIMDGFDVQALGYVAPAIIQDWNISSTVLGPVFGAGNFGVLVGSLGFSVLADRIGRRPVLIAATLFFAIMTLLTARAQSVETLLGLRLIAGIGLGGIIPNATALISEYSPRRHRVTLMMGITVGFTAGAAIGGFIAAWLIPAFGWRSVFYVGGFVPLVIVLMMFIWLPESLQFMTLRGGHREEVVRWLRQIDPNVPVDGSTEYVVDEPSRRGVPIVHLFREGRTLVTVLYWVVNFMNLLNLYALASWLPTVVSDAGYSTSTAVLVGSILQVGGTIGTFGLAWLIARRGFVPVLSTSFGVAAASIAVVGQPGLSLAVLCMVVFVAGWCVVGGQPGINAFGATYYPTSVRSTGVGWGLGIGRIGAIVGPVVGGELMRLDWSVQDMFLVAAAPALISAVAMGSLNWVMTSRTSST